MNPNMSLLRILQLWYRIKKEERKKKGRRKEGRKEGKEKRRKHHKKIEPFFKMKQEQFIKNHSFKELENSLRTAEEDEIKKALEESFRYRSPWAAYLITQHLKQKLDSETLKSLSDIAIKNDDFPLLEILENNRKSEENPALVQDFTEGTTLQELTTRM